MSETAEQTLHPEPEDRGDLFEADPAEDGSTEFDAGDLDKLIQELEPAKPAETSHEMPSSIPIGRFKEVNDKYKATAEENARLQAELEAARRLPSAEDLRTQEQRYIELINEGEWDEAANVRLEINAALMRAATIEAERNSESRAQMKEAEAVSNKIWDENPWLHGNEEAQEDFRTWRVIGENKGLSKARALEFAASKLKPLYAEASAESGEESTDKRPAEALQRGMRDAKKQPPHLGGLGARANATRTREYTDEELAGMPKDEVARMRGDYV